LLREAQVMDLFSPRQPSP